VQYVDLGHSITLVENFFDITYVQNYGAGFSILQNGRTVFLIITPICLIAFVYLLLTTKKSDKLARFSLLLMIGGTIGNFIDRIFNVYVVDFLDFFIIGYDFPVFNFADICLTVGIFLYIITILLEKKDA